MIFSKKYDIERFWCPTDGTIGLDRWGYLQDPHCYTAWMGESDSIPFEYIEDVPVLLMLGEPGTGKSQWFRDAENRLGASIRQRGHQDLWIDLGLYDSGADVVAAVFRCPEFVRWTQGGCRLHLFLDSFDECYARVRVLPKRLLDELRGIPIERLCLRIFCRTAEWPLTLEEGLERLWTDRMEAVAASVKASPTQEASSKSASLCWVQAFELAPLRRDDVLQIVQGEGLEPLSFLPAVESRALVPFANRPQTLAFLVTTYQRNGSFPANQVDLYREGCEELCREPTRDRTDAHLSGRYQADELLAVSERLAALTIFANRHSILRYNPSASEIRDTDISFGDVCHGLEKVNGREVPVREDIIREALNTGLFSGRPDGRMGWAHQTYAEFLAAGYLCRNSLPVNQIMTLIKHPHSPEDKIPPQLAETAAWLGLLNQEVADELMVADPEILLLRRDLVSRVQQEGSNEKLVGTLLKLLDSGRLLDHRILRMRTLGNLQHPGLGPQLLPFISDTNKNFVVRCVAIRIAEENRVKEVQHAVCKLTLDPEDDYLVRQPAAHALLRIAEDDVKSRLKPLIRGERGDDPNDELKGCALIALWPDHLTAGEVFDNLTPPKNPNFLGSYQTFLSNVLLDRMHPKHLPTALNWVQRHPGDQGQHFLFRGIVDSIMLLAYDHLEYPAVFEQFARAARHRLREYEEIIPHGPKGKYDSILYVDEIKRHRLFVEMLSLASASGESARFEERLLTNVVHKGDLQWLIDLFRRETRQKVRDIVAFLLAWFVDSRSVEEFETIYELSAQSTTLQEALRPVLGPVSLDSTDADVMRRRFSREQEAMQAREPEGERQLCSQDIILKYLDDIEQGNFAKFAGLTWRMIDREPESCLFNSLRTDLLTLNSWTAAREDTRLRIIQAAEDYITNCSPYADEWLGTGKIYWSAWAGYIALVLFLRVRSHSLVEISKGTWSKWVPAIVACSSGQEIAASETLLASAYAVVPDAVISNVNCQIDYENKSAKHVWVLEKLTKCWDDRLTRAIIEKLHDPSLTPDSFDAILTVMSKHDVDAVVSFAKSQLGVPLPARGRSRILALVAAKVLMLNIPGLGWPFVWPAVAGARLFGRRLLILLAKESHSALEPLCEILSEDELSTLYAWISREFPLSEVETSERFLRVPNVHSIGESILQHLENRGTTESVLALQALCTQMPEQAERLRWVLAAAKDRTLAKTWTPLRPEEILDQVQDHHKRLVQSGDQLLDVVIESVKRFQQSLHKELPAVRDLWDRQLKRLQEKGKCKNQGKIKEEGKEKYTWVPLDERPLTDRVARHLREDLTEKGIVIGREVQIRPGQFTDIHVDGVATCDNADRLNIIKVIVEVKGCWNVGMEQDMEGQLLERYMNENSCNHGLFLVGWFHCDSWDQRDYRSKRPSEKITEMSIEKVQELLDRQSAELSGRTGKVIRAFVLDSRMRKSDLSA